MKSFLSKLALRGGDLAIAQPLLTLFLATALLAFFLSLIFNRTKDAAPAPGLAGMCLGMVVRLILGAAAVLSLLFVLSLMRTYLHQNLAAFQHSHGRITEANYHAVETIWGSSQEQGDLGAELFYEEETVERMESEDLTKPAILRKKIVRHVIPTNPFLRGRHEVSLHQNTRRKGSALYGGYETVCQFSWQLKNPATRAVRANLKFPLPAAGAMYDDLTSSLNGRDVLPEIQLHDYTLLLSRDLQPGEVLDFTIGFRSRGMSVWFFQVREPREIRDFSLTLALPEIPAGRLNYPEGCMSPTRIQPSPDGQGSILTYRLEHAISSKGMGVELPSLPQPGAATNAVLAETETGWMLVFAMLLLGLSIAGIPHAAGISILFSLLSAFGYSFVADASDLLHGFWISVFLVLAPIYLFLAWALPKAIGSRFARWWAAQLLGFGLLYPCLAGLDPAHRSLYFNIAALLFTGFTAWQLAIKYRPSKIT